MTGVALVIASACVLNNVIDKNIDKKMSRTKKRAIVSGDISVNSAFIYSFVLGALGVGFMLIFSNLITLYLGFVAFISYVFIYAIAKRKTIHGTLVGAIPGALPPVAGYTAYSGSLDFAAFLLFLFLVLWQLPHFYSIALLRKKDYKSAGLPVISVKKSTVFTKNIILFCIVLLIIPVLLLAKYSYVGYIFSVIISLLIAIWFFIGIKIYSLEAEKWGKKMFLFSLIVLLAFSTFISIDSYFISK